MALVALSRCGPGGYRKLGHARVGALQFALLHLFNDAGDRGAERSIAFRGSDSQGIGFIVEKDDLKFGQRVAAPCEKVAAAQTFSLGGTFRTTCNETHVFDDHIVKLFVEWKEEKCEGWLESLCRETNFGLFGTIRRFVFVMKRCDRLPVDAGCLRRHWRFATGFQNYLYCLLDVNWWRRSKKPALRINASML